MHYSELKIGRVVEVFYDDGVVLLGMVKAVYPTLAAIDVIDANNANYINGSVTIIGHSCHARVEGKNGWTLPV